jgi:hypothetical protein
MLKGRFLHRLDGSPHEGRMLFFPVSLFGESGGGSWLLQSIIDFRKSNYKIRK